MQSVRADGNTAEKDRADGRPGAGKTAVLELVRQALCNEVGLISESAGILFGGGFPRRLDIEGRRAAQRAIYHVQSELEAMIGSDHVAIALCDRGTVDGAAYWPGPDELWREVGTTLAEELARYHAVIHLRTPAAEDGYNWQNPLRLESAAEALAIDARIASVWAKHPRRFEVPVTPEFLTKATRVIEILRSELAACRSESDTPVHRLHGGSAASQKPRVNTGASSIE